MENKLANIEARLINLENMLAQMQQGDKGFIKQSPTFIEKLRPALEEGGPLAGGRSCSATILRDFSRSWRNLITDLRFSANSARRIEAEALLNQLSVIRYKEGNMKMFCTI